MSATIALHVENQIVTKIKIPTDDLDDQLAAMALLNCGLIKVIQEFNESQVHNGNYRFADDAKTREHTAISIEDSK